MSSNNQYNVCYKAPSNIAFIKYWGKEAKQIPMNPSISMTLDKCYTEMEIQFTPAAKTIVKSFEFEGQQNEQFKNKIQKYLDSVSANFKEQVELSIKSENSFPHSAGIASSASSMAALSCCLGDFFDWNLKTSSSYARLASGSACRSLFPKYAVWGKSLFPTSDNEYAVSFDEYDQKFEKMNDSVLIISGETKSISSSAGHQLMNEHFYKQGRVKQVNHHFEMMLKSMSEGDFDTFGQILETEAMSLHALMMSGPEAFTLLKPNSLLAIDKIRSFRQDSKLPVYFTIDAGPNIHLIYPSSAETDVRSFIDSELKSCCENELVIHDQIGNGPIKLK